MYYFFKLTTKWMMPHYCTICLTISNLSAFLVQLIFKKESLIYASFVKELLKYKQLFRQN